MSIYPTIALRRYRAYMRGFQDGAGMHPIDDMKRAQHVHEYDLGFSAGKAALREAMKHKAIELEIVIQTLRPMDQPEP